MTRLNPELFEHQVMTTFPSLPVWHTAGYGGGRQKHPSCSALQISLASGLKPLSREGVHVFMVMNSECCVCTLKISLYLRCWYLGQQHCGAQLLISSVVPFVRNIGGAWAPPRQAISSWSLQAACVHACVSIFCSSG